MKLQDLRKSYNHSQAFGVSAGFAYFLEWPVWVVRLFWILAMLIYGWGIIAYIILAIALPEWDTEPDDFAKVIGVN